MIHTTTSERFAAIRNLLICLVLACGLFAIPPSGDFRFVIVGDRTGEAVPGVYEQIWRDAAADHPAFAITVGDSIQGLNDGTVNIEWRQTLQLLRPYRRLPIYFTPGNHDIWSPLSAAAYTRYTHRPLHYSFDYSQAHFVILDEHENDPRAPIAAPELAFLAQDLQAHKDQPLKFVFSHTPWWLLNTVLHNPESPLQRLAKRYGVQYIVSGHLHQMLHFKVDDVEYLSMPSAGGHLRASKRYEDGWFFAHTLVEVHGLNVTLTTKETGAPFGEARASNPTQWGAAGLLREMLTK